MAYQPANGDGDPQIGGDAELEGWQQLLDLLDERAGASFDDLWTDWIVNDDEQREMEDRAAARVHYAVVVQDAGTWNLPKDLRASMGSWTFDEAEAGLSAAAVIIDARDEIAADAGALDLTPPAELKELFEREGGMNAARAEADLQIEVLSDISAATERLAESQTVLEWVGLLGADPAADLKAARTGFEADDLDAAEEDAERALADRTGAAEAGQTRVLVTGGSLIVLTGATVVGVRVRSRRRAAAAAAPVQAELSEPEAAQAEPADELLEPPA
jgi:hypothetical protein